MSKVGTDLETIDDYLGQTIVPASPSLFGTDDPVEIVAQAARVAQPLAEVVESQKLYQTFGGSKKHVELSGWTLLGGMLKVYAKVTEMHKLSTDGGGWEAYAEVQNIHGDSLGGQWGQCTRSEANWAKRDDYALRGMAQTRACSRALRQTLGFVMTLAGFDATPAEEMPSSTGNFVAPTGADKPKGKLATKAQVADLAALLMAHPDEVGKLASYLGQRDTYGTEDLKELTGEHATKLIEELKAA